MRIYVELKDICESLIHCNDIITVGYAKDLSNNTIDTYCIEVYYKTGNSLRYHYNNMDQATDDLKRIKSAIGSVRGGVIYYADRNLIEI